MTTNAATSRTRLFLAFAAIYIIWGSTYLGIRVAVETMPPFLAGGMRFLIAGLVLSTWIFLKHGFRANARQWRDNLVIGGLLLLAGNGLVMWAEQTVPSGITTLILSCGPLFVVMTDWAVLRLSPAGSGRGAKPTIMTLFGLALGFFGLVLLINGGADGAKLDLLHCGALLLGCFSWSSGSLYSRYTRNPAEPLTAAAMQMLCGGALMLAAGLCGGETHGFHLAAVSRNSWLAWSYLIVAGSLFAFPCFVWLLNHTAPARVSTHAYVNPVVAVFLGWLILDEHFSFLTVLAAGVIIAAVIIITVQRGKTPVKKPENGATPAHTSR